MQFIGKKAAYALGQNLKVMACIGELLEEREAGKTFEVCFKQLKAFAGQFYLPLVDGPEQKMIYLRYVPFR
jgi:triosephosphate isomerase